MTAQNINLIYKDSKANIEALPSSARGFLAVTTDTGEIGYHNGTSWVWGTLTGEGATTEEVQDIVGDMVSSNTETGIAVTYDDGTGKINLVTEVTNDNFPDKVQEAIAAAPPHPEVDIIATDNIPVLASDFGWELRAMPINSLTAYLQVIFNSLYAPSNKGVTNGDTHDHNGGDGGTISYNSLSNRPTIATNANDIFRVNFCGTSGFTATINGSPSGASVAYTPVSGNENTLVPDSTSQLGKQRLYNTTRGNYALISTCNTGTDTITLTANAPANWASGDTITTISTTVSGSGRNWVDIEITGGDLLNKTQGFFSLTMHEPGSAIGAATLWMHPTESYSDSKVFNIMNKASGATESSLMAMKITSNVITASWTASGASSAIPIIRQVGYL